VVGYLKNYFIASCSQYVAVKKIEIWLIFGEDTENDKVARFLGHSVLCLTLRHLNRKLANWLLLLYGMFAQV